MDQGTTQRAARLPWRRLKQGLTLIVLATLLAIPFDTASAALGPPPPTLVEASVRYVAPSPAGRADGSDWANAAPLTDLPTLMAGLSLGGEILVRADAGPYSVTKPIILGNRESETPLTIRGIDPSGGGAVPLLVGARSEPYSPENSDTGRPAFGLDTGANNVTFSNLRFQNFGNGCFVLRGAIRDLTISDVSASNVRRFIENEDNELANVVGLVVRRTTVTGFSKDAVRLQNDTHDVLIEDVVVDSQFQDGDHFAMGFHFIDTVHDVVFRRVVAKNAWDTASDYHNGDGFASERETYDLTFRNTRAVNNMDAGYDIKSSDVVFVRAKASGNKRNFRLWGSNISMRSSRGAGPVRRGGTGTPAQVWAGPGADFAIERSSFVRGDAGTVVFDLEAAAVGIAKRTTIARAPGSLLSHLSESARLMLNGTALPKRHR